MAKIKMKIDVLSLIIGILFSLVAQGIYDALFYYATGKILEELVVVAITFMFLALAVVIVVLWIFLRAIKQTQKPNS